MSSDSQRGNDYLPRRGLHRIVPADEPGPCSRRLSREQRRALLDVPPKVNANDQPREFLQDLVRLIGQIVQAKVASPENGAGPGSSPPNPPPSPRSPSIQRRATSLRSHECDTRSSRGAVANLRSRLDARRACEPAQSAGHSHHRWRLDSLRAGISRSGPQLFRSSRSRRRVVRHRRWTRSLNI